MRLPGDREHGGLTWGLAINQAQVKGPIASGLHPSPLETPAMHRALPLAPNEQSPLGFWATGKPRPSCCHSNHESLHNTSNQGVEEWEQL